jgi:hypothetical protein
MKALRVTLAIAALALGMAMTASAQSKGTLSAEGVVKSDAGEPVAGVVVNFLAGGGGVVQGKTDAAGHWTVTGLGKGEWRAMFIAAGYATQVVKVQVKDTGTNEVAAVLMKKAGN